MTTRAKTRLAGCLMLLVGGAAVLPLQAQEPDAFEQWLRHEQQAYQQFIDDHDRAFLAYLERAWKVVRLRGGLEPDRIPKPRIIPVAPTPPEPFQEPDPVFPPGDTLDLGDALDFDPGTGHEAGEPSDGRSAALPATGERVIPPPAPMRMAHTVFFGMPIEIGFDPALVRPLTDPPGPESISAFWRHLSGTRYQPVLEAVQRQRRALALNDWGYYLLLHDLGRYLYGGQENEANLFVWFMMTKSGYEARVGYNEDQIFLMLASDHQVYKLPQLVIEGDRYYLFMRGAVPRQLGALYTYDGHYPEARRTIDFTIATAPRLAAQPVEKTVTFRYRTEPYTLRFTYDQTLVRFFESYPLAEFTIYFNAGLGTATQRALIAALQPLVAGRSEVDAVNLVLRFVQRGFRYRRDGDQFGYERYLFPEETLAASFSDCEDRSFLFAHLVRTLLRLDVVGLDYPGHIATAVKLSEPVDGQYVMHEGARYYVADPTYFGADVGMALPQVEQVQPKVIAAR